MIVWCHLPQRHPVKFFYFQVQSFQAPVCRLFLSVPTLRVPVDAEGVCSFQFFLKLSPTLSQSDRFTTPRHIIQTFLINNFIIKTFFWKCNSVKHWKIYFNKDMPCAFSNGTYILQLKTLFYIKPKILQEVIHCVYKVLEGFCLVFFSLNNLAFWKSGSKAFTTRRKGGRSGVSGALVPSIQRWRGACGESRLRKSACIRRNRTGILPPYFLQTPPQRH